MSLPHDPRESYTMTPRSQTCPKGMTCPFVHLPETWKQCSSQHCTSLRKQNDFGARGWACGACTMPAAWVGSPINIWHIPEPCNVSQSQSVYHTSADTERRSSKTYFTGSTPKDLLETLSCINKECVRTSHSQAVEVFSDVYVMFSALYSNTPSILSRTQHT